MKQWDTWMQERPLLFLDIDGVVAIGKACPIAESSRPDRRLVARINKVIEATGCKVVLSSAWRYLMHSGSMTIEGLDCLFRSHGLKAGVIVGITHMDTPTEWDEMGRPCKFVEDERALQVQRFRLSHGHTGPYVVIDNDDFGFTAAGMPFVRTMTSIGINPADTKRAIDILLKRYP